jgi:hypothetical protein
MVARLFEEAARIARRGVLLIDGSRSSLHAVSLTAVGLLRFGSPDFVHDAVISLRRFFVPEEMLLLARLGSHDQGVRARWFPPSHLFLRYFVDQNSNK